MTSTEMVPVPIPLPICNLYAHSEKHHIMGGKKIGKKQYLYVSFKPVRTCDAHN